MGGARVNSVTCFARCHHGYIYYDTKINPERRHPNLPAVRAQGPSTLMITLNEQPEEKWRVLHLLHIIPERRGEEFDTIEDVIPVYNIHASVRADFSAQEVTLVP